MSEMSMRERVARAICRQHNLDEGFSEEQVDSPLWRELDANYRKCADAVLEALREPTSGMIQRRIDRYPHELRIRPNDLVVWYDMVDAAEAGA